MINFWECAQGLLFMGVFGVITRRALGQDSPGKRSSAPQAASQAAMLLPVPRVAPEEEHGTLPVG